MGQGCSSACGTVEPDCAELSRTDSPDPVMYDLMRKSIQATTSTSGDGGSGPQSFKMGKRKPPGQNHLLYRNSKIETTPVPVSAAVQSSTVSATKATETSSYKSSVTVSADSRLWLPMDTPVPCPTRLLIRRRSLRVVEEGGGTHIYAIRYPEDTPDKIISEQSTPRQESARQEQCPPKKGSRAASATTDVKTSQRDSVSSSTQKTVVTSKPKVVITQTLLEGTDIFSAAAMASRPRQKVMDWVPVSEDHNIYIADVGLTALQCDHIVNSTEQVCRGQYAAYTYAKQTLGCREYPTLAQTSFSPVHTVTSDIIKRLANGKQDLQLDDREPHIVKYDVTKKERQKLDMHTDKSEWTFLIALSNGCGVDYEGGGTYFECLDATVHIQKGHALIFPGKLRHCGQKITSGLRFLLVGFLVDKSISTTNSVSNSGSSSKTSSVTATTTNIACSGQTPVSVKA